jgi:hypothetical protein
MAARVLLGENQSGLYGLFISRPGDNVLSPSNPLLFSSEVTNWSGQVYAGGQASSTTGINWSATKGSISVASTNIIPLVISVDDQIGKYRAVGPSSYIGFDTRDLSNQSTFETTTTNINPVRFITLNPNSTIVTESMGTSRTSTNLKFFVLKMPCAYGYMSSTYMAP